MSEPPSLLDMPDIPLDMILGGLGFKEIQVLRKVNRNLREHIDDTQPEGDLTTITMHQDDKSFYVELQSNNSTYTVEYKKKDSGCQVKHAGKKHKVSADYITRAFKDLQLLLNHQHNIRFVFLHGIRGLSPAKYFTKECGIGILRVDRRSAFTLNLCRDYRQIWPLIEAVEKMTKVDHVYVKVIQEVESSHEKPGRMKRFKAWARKTFSIEWSFRYQLLRI